MIQAEISRRKSIGNYYSGNSVFSSKLVCGGCGGFYGQKLWHSTDAYRRVIWQCNSKFKSNKKCTTPHLDAEIIQQMFLKAYNQLMGNRDGIIEDCEIIRTTLCDCSELDADIEKLQEKIQIIAELVKNCVQENAVAAQPQENYTTRYNSLVKRYEKTIAKHEALTTEKMRKIERDKELHLFIEALRKRPLVLEAWDEKLWISLIDKATVHTDGSIAFKFKNETIIEVESK